jgi:hypothetical protein
LKAPAAHKDMILGGNALRFIKRQEIAHEH